jgi:TnpA family transposase
VTRRQQLSEAQIAALFDPTDDRRELLRHYTLSDDDLAMIGLSRGDHNRIGRALMLCYLRYPGRPLTRTDVSSEQTMRERRRRARMAPTSLSKQGFARCAPADPA